MAVTAKMYAKAPLSILNKEADFNSDSIKCALFTATLSASRSADQYFDAAPYSSNQVAATNGYATGGVVCATPTIGTTALVTKIDSADPAWTVAGAGFHYRTAVFYDSSPASNKPLLSYVNFGADVTAAAGTHTIVLDANGIARITVS